MAGLDRKHAGVSGYGASRVGRSAHVGQEYQGTPGPRSRPSDEAVPSRGPERPIQPKMPSHRVRLRTAGAATDHPSRAGTAGWRAAGTTVHATLAQAGVSFRDALVGLGPSRGQHLRTELLAGAA